jgi:XRE family transcriptional regulator, regulator of sulfur utilization
MARINENIRILRLSRNFSQKELADRLDLSPGAYSNIENGKADVTYTRMLNIAEILGVTITELINLNKENVSQFYPKTEGKISGDTNSLLQQMIDQEKETITTLKEYISELKEKANYYKELYQEIKEKLKE